ncbi:MAG: MATE family efflux transporter [Clostridiales bacterium]|nr:MATE family efflux transporter [Clostridiales bacterium]
MTKDMTNGNPLKIILLFSIPVLLGNLFQQFYNMVDTIIVGRYLGEDALAAVGSTGCLMFLVLGFANGIAQGFGVMISHAFGAKDYRLLKHYVALSLMLTVIVSLLLTIPTVAASRLLLLWMNTPENIVAMADSYIKVIFAGIIFTMSYNVVSGILRGIGDSKTPLYFLIFSSVLNIILDIFLIVTVNLGTAGAAYATIIAQGVSAVFCFIYMFRKFDILRTSRDDYYLDARGVKNMLSIGIPMALNYSITAIGTMILQSAINVFGSSVVAAFTAACKVNNIATQPMPTLGTAMATYCGQNLGAGRYDRISEGMKQGFFLCIGTAVFAAVFCIFGGEFVVSWFVSNPSEEIFTYAMQYLTTISWFFLPLGMIFLYRNALQGLNEGLIPMLSGIIEMICRIGVILLVPTEIGFIGVCFADPAAWIGAGLPLFITYLVWKKQHCIKSAKKE